MMRVRCPYCSWMVVLKPDEMAAGIASARELKSAHHVLDCPKCRRAIKVSVKQMKRQLPPGYKPPVAPAGPGSDVERPESQPAETGAAEAATDGTPDADAEPSAEAGN